MPTITLNKINIANLLKRKLKDVELVNAINMLGPSVENMEGDELSVEVPPNRPDLLSEQGMARALSSFLGIKPGLKKYSVKKSNQKVIVEDAVASVRPFTACAIVKGLKCTDERIKDIIKIQEKLHITYGRKRKKCAIGIYPLEHIKLPIRFTAKKPEDIVFAPLDLNKELNATQILVLHPTGREYGDLLKNEKKYPLFIDAKNNVMSMPPIINSNSVGKITEKTRDVFIEVSGFDFEYLNTALCILVAALADMGGEIYSIDVQYKGKRKTTPEFNPWIFKIDPETVNRRLGTMLNEQDIRKALAKMGHDYAGKTVMSPRWRSDLLHPVDFVEDIAIALGYDKIPAQQPQIAATGKADGRTNFAEAIRDVLVGLGGIEVKNYHLTSDKIQNKLLNLNEQSVALANAFSEDYSALRSNLTAGILLTLKENKTREFPQLIFEIGTIFRKAPDHDTLVHEQMQVVIALSEASASFTKMRQVLQTLSSALAIELEVHETVHPAMIEGRTAAILHQGKHAGIVGEIHPAILENFQLEMPTVITELSVSELRNHPLALPSSDNASATNNRASGKKRLHR